MLLQRAVYAAHAALEFQHLFARATLTFFKQRLILVISVFIGICGQLLERYAQIYAQQYRVQHIELLCVVIAVMRIRVGICGLEYAQTLIIAQ